MSNEKEIVSAVTDYVNTMNKLKYTKTPIYKFALERQFGKEITEMILEKENKRL